MASVKPSPSYPVEDKKCTMRRQAANRLTYFAAFLLLLLFLKWYAGYQILVVRSEPAVALDDPMVRKWNVTSLDNQFYIVSMLSLFCGNRWPGYERFTQEDLNNRDLEYLATLESNLDHPLVKQVHLFYSEDEALSVVKQQMFAHQSKIVPVKVERRVHMMDFFHYASLNLLDKPVVAMNGDIALGEGFDLIDTDKLRENRVLYTLTRHGYQKSGCVVENYCLDKKYQGSHDTHVFRLARPLNETIVLRLDYPINMWQAENGMIGVFRNQLQFKVYNPCRTLKTYHHHCSTVHKQGRQYSIKDQPYGFKYEEFGKAAPLSDLLY